MQLVIFKPINPMDTVKYQQWQNNEKVDIIGTVNDAFMEFIFGCKMARCQGCALNAPDALFYPKRER